MVVLIRALTTRNSIQPTGTPTSISRVVYPFQATTAATYRAAATATWLAVNNQWPAEPLVVDKCSQVKLTVKNKVPDEDVSLHFHGILQAGGQVVMDGTEGITQR